MIIAYAQLLYSKGYKCLSNFLKETIHFLFKRVHRTFFSFEINLKTRIEYFFNGKQLKTIIAEISYTFPSENATHFGIHSS